MQEIDFKPSRRLGLLLGAMALLVVYALVRAELSPEGRLAALALAAAVAAHSWHRRRPPERLRVLPDGRLQRCGGAGDAWEDVEVLPESFVSTALIVLRYRADGKTRSRTLLADSAGAESLRRLRVSLRWSRRTRSDTASPDAG